MSLSPSSPGPAAFRVALGPPDDRYGVRVHTERRSGPAAAALGHVILTGSIDRRVARTVVHLLDAVVGHLRALSLELTVTDVTAIGAVDAHWLLGAAAASRRRGGLVVLTGPVPEPLRCAADRLHLPMSALPRCGCLPVARPVVHIPAQAGNLLADA